MPGITFTVELSEAEARERLSALVARMERPIGFYKNVGQYMVDVSIPRNFATETAPDGTPWVRHATVTIKRREKLGHMPLQILRSNRGDSQNLHATINADPSEDGVRIGSPMIYAGVHQFGAGQGAFGRTSRNGPIPWGDIPARPFLGLSAVDEQEIINIAEDWLAAE